MWQLITTPVSIWSVIFVMNNTLKNSVFFLKEHVFFSLALQSTHWKRSNKDFTAVTLILFVFLRICHYFLSISPKNLCVKREVSLDTCLCLCTTNKSDELPDTTPATTTCCPWVSEVSDELLLRSDLQFHRLLQL